MVTKAAYKIEKLSDVSLENISGGLTCKQTATIINVGVYTALGTGVGAIGCAIASAVYSSKSSTALQQGENSKSLSYSNTAKYLSIGAASLGSIGILAAATNFGVSLTHGKTCTLCAIGKPPKSFPS